MPMIDVYAPAGLIPPANERRFVEELTAALLRAEHAPAAEPFLSNTAAYLHVLPPAAVHTAASAEAKTVRVQVLTPPGAIDEQGQKSLVAEATAIVADATGDPEQAQRTWVLLTEAAEGGWGVAGTAFGKAEFDALRG